MKKSKDLQKGLVGIIVVIIALALLFFTVAGVFAAVKAAAYSPVGSAVSWVTGGGGKEPVDFGQYSGSSNYPIEPPILTGNTLHDCTVKRPYDCNDPGHRKFHNTGVKMGDAVDIASQTGNQTVYAIFDGKAELKGSGDLRNIRLHSSENPGMFAIYAHVKNRKSGEVKKGEPIGTYIVKPGTYYHHVHFELWLNSDQSITGDPNISASQSKKYNHSIWENIAQYLNLEPKWSGSI